ncbi:response regulator [Parapusillimonas granuli]|uniref:Response regulator transcription factor n=1 Tax=Parapusillimonas granuli TaxID=380911 RepID=A0A853G3U6_9BURK|nr:response regulator transcription factor [Parapusillimonas granuli]MBB5214874.1 two-component system nitrate/nitrite response regulator NarL [Parapusillimonas granuli]MEB2399930.1 response regulator transcription factor [Alcaligenaceae bacterium]NYT49196.1 response regulator transcription factor [Parapusillimonas granuli]
MTIRILLIDDHTLFRSGVRLLLKRQSDFEIVAEAADGIEGLKRARELTPDVILLDLNMPGLSGLEVLQILSQDLPDCAVIVLTVSEEGDELAEALRHGARGYLIKNIDADALVTGIRRAVAGEPVIDPAMTGRLIDQFRKQAATPARPENDAQRSKLSTREMQVAQLLARGASNKVIARELNVTESTVKIHVQNVLKKLNLTSRVQIAVYMVERGLAGADEQPADKP